METNRNVRYHSINDDGAHIMSAMKRLVRLVPDINNVIKISSRPSSHSGDRPNAIHCEQVGVVFSVKPIIGFVLFFFSSPIFAAIDFHLHTYYYQRSVSQFVTFHFCFRGTVPPSAATFDGPISRSTLNNRRIAGGTAHVFVPASSRSALSELRTGATWLVHAFAE